jgi:hypothetical protein
MTAFARCSDASLVVSACHWERYIERFLDDVGRFVAEMEGTAAITVELVCILNSPSNIESQAASRLRSLESGHVVIRTLEVERETLYATWNRGIGLSTAGALGFWNVDDCRYPAAVVEGVQGMRSGASLMYFPFFIDHRWRKWRFLPRRRRELYPAIEFEAESFRRTFRVGPFFMFSRELYNAVGPFDEQFAISGDLDWILRALRVTSFTPGSQVAGVFLNEFRGLSMSGSQRAIAEHNVICRRHGSPELVRPCSGDLVAAYDVEHIHARGVATALRRDAMSRFECDASSS